MQDPLTRRVLSSWRRAFDAAKIRVELPVAGRRSRDRVGQTIRWTYPRCSELPLGPTGPVLLTEILDGFTADDYRRSAAILATVWRVSRVVVEPAEAGHVILRVIGRDLLRDPITHADLVRVRTGDPLRVPCARTETGDWWEWPYSSTLLVGASGSGKSGAVWSIVTGLQAARRRGEVVLVGCDPKAIEIRTAPWLFDLAVYELDEIGDLLEAVAQELQRRLRAPATARSWTLDRGPLIAVVIDELPAILTDRVRTRREAAQQNLDVLLRMGRSFGIAVVGASQAPQKDVIGDRTNYVSRVCLRLPNAREVDLVLGEGQSTVAPAHMIPPAHAANGYATAGLAWVQDETGHLIRVRFAHLTDADREAYRRPSAVA